MDLAKYVVSKITDVISNPYTIKVCSSLEYQSSVLLQHEWKISLYVHNEAYDCVLFNDFVSNHDLRLFRLSLSKKSEAIKLFETYCQCLSKLLIDAGQLYDPPKLQLLCTAIKDHNKWSIAHIAVQSGIIDLINKEILKGTLNSQNCTSSKSPLQLACDLKRFDIFEKLLQQNASLCVQDDVGDSIFHYAVAKVPSEYLKALCSNENHESSINLQNLKSETPLHIASKLNKPEAVKYLLEANANVNICSKIGYPIHYAMKYCKDNEVFEMLLKHDPAQSSKICKLHGGSPMHWCRNHNHFLILKTYSPNMNFQSNEGHVPLHVMVIKNRLDVAISMILYGTDINSRGRHGNVALHLAVETDDVELVKMLLLFGADCNAVNEFGETPGLLFIRSNKPNKEKILKLLSSIGGVVLDKSVVHKQTKTNQEFLNNIFNDTPDPKSGSTKSYGNIDNVDGGAYSTANKSTAKVLCLDGGGIRGLVLTQILIAIEQITGKPIKESFDWIAGTSTGGLLALALMVGKSAVDCQRLYFNLKDKVFSGSRPYNSSPMEEFLKEEFGVDTTMSDIAGDAKVIITATLLDENPARLFLFRNYTPPYEDVAYMKSIKAMDIIGQPKTAEGNTNISPLNVPLWQVARSSGAAPTYFRSVGKFVDGGLVSNNPTLDVLTEIHKVNKSLKNSILCKTEVKDIGLVVSVGTGIPPKKPLKYVDIMAPTTPVALVNSAMASFQIMQVMVDIACECDQHVQSRAEAWCESIDVPYFRLNPQMNTEVMLNETDDRKLIDLMWETKLFIFKNKHKIEEIVHLLNA